MSALALQEMRAENPLRRLLPLRARRAHEAQVMRDMPNPKGLVLTWVEKKSLFIAMVPKANGTWKQGYVSVTIPPHEAVGLELFIGRKTESIIAQFQKGGAL